MNAAAPITGGMTCPPVEEAATTAPEKAGLNPAFFHQRNGKGSGGYRICHGASGDRSHKAAGYHRCLARPPLTAPRKGQSEIDEELSRPGDLQNGPEEDEEKDERGGDPQGHSEDAVGAKILEGGDLFDGESPVPQNTREVGAEERIEYGNDGHNGKRPPHGTAPPFDDKNNHHDTQIDVRGYGHSLSHGDGVPVEKDVQTAHHHHPRKNPVPKVNLVLGAGFCGGIEEKDQASHEHPVDPSLIHGGKKPEGRSIQVEDGGGKGNARHHPVLPSRKLTSVCFDNRFLQSRRRCLFLGQIMFNFHIETSTMEHHKIFWEGSRRFFSGSAGSLLR